MRISSAFLAVILVGGCGKAGKDKNPTDDSAAPPVPTIEFKNSAGSADMAGFVHEDSLLAHKATNLILGSIGLAVADEGVRERMQGHSTGARSSHCWTGPLIPQSTFTIDYTNCAQVGISGGLIFNEDPLGPIGMDFKSVAFDATRVTNGALGFDADGAVALHWRLFDTVGSEPSMANRSPVSLQVDGRDVSLAFDGGGFLRPVNQNMAVWGVLDFTPYGGEPLEVLIGGTDPAALTTSSHPDEPASMPWSYLSCRCPTAGVFSQQLGFEITEVSFDLDDLKTEDDGVDDPVAKVDVSLNVTGPVEYRPVNCGEWDVTYDAGEGTEVVLSSEELKDAIQELCDTAVIDDGMRCAGLLKAAAGVDSVTINIGPNKLANGVQDEASVEFDTSYCIP